jgi:hypothetical protein
MIVLEITLESGERRWAVGLTMADLSKLMDRPLDVAVITDLEPGVQLHIFAGRDDDQLKEFVTGQMTYGKEEHRA